MFRLKYFANVKSRVTVKLRQLFISMHSLINNILYQEKNQVVVRPTEKVGSTVEKLVWRPVLVNTSGE